MHILSQLLWLGIASSHLLTNRRIKRWRRESLHCNSNTHLTLDTDLTRSEYFIYRFQKGQVNMMSLVAINELEILICVQKTFKLYKPVLKLVGHHFLQPFNHWPLQNLHITPHLLLSWSDLSRQLLLYKWWVIDKACYSAATTSSLVLLRWPLFPDGSSCHPQRTVWGKRTQSCSSVGVLVWLWTDFSELRYEVFDCSNSDIRLPTNSQCLSVLCSNASIFC